MHLHVLSIYLNYSKIYIQNSFCMKTREQQKAIALRKGGVSMGEIARRINVAKSSVSYWVRDIPLTKEQRGRLNANGYSIDAIEKRRIARLANTKRKHDELISAGASEVVHLLCDPLWCIGIALYWGEGGKTQQCARLSNSDPAAIKLMMKFFKKYSGVDASMYRAHIHTHSGENAQKALVYWSRISGIPQTSFYKTYVKKSKVTKNKRRTLPFGTMQICIHNSDFFYRMIGWLRGVEQSFV
jgi:transposase-like protein